MELRLLKNTENDIDDELEEKKDVDTGLTLPKIFYEFFVEPVSWTQVGYTLTARIKGIIVGFVEGSPLTRRFGNRIRMRSFGGDKFYDIPNTRIVGGGADNQGGSEDIEKKKGEFEKLIQKHLRYEFANFLQPEVTSKTQRYIKRLK